MICPECSAIIEKDSQKCPFCGCVLVRQHDTHKNNGEYAAPSKKKEHNVETGIYKLICVAMGLCLIAGSVVWASLLLRDRIDSPTKDNAVRQTAYDDDQQAEDLENEDTDKPQTTAAPKKTTTQTTTTTANPFTAAVAPKYTDDYGSMYSSVDSLAIRIGPGYDYTSLEEGIPSGTQLFISAEQIDARSGETWCYIDYNGNAGWVCKSYLSDKNPTTAVVMPDELYDSSDVTSVTVTRYGGLKLYSGPGEDYDVLAVIPEDEEIEKLGYNYFSVKWIYTEYNGQPGWVVSYEGDWFNPTVE